MEYYVHHTADLFKDRIQSVGGYVMPEDTFPTGYVRDRILSDEDTFGADTFGADMFGKDTK